MKKLYLAFLTGLVALPLSFGQVTFNGNGFTGFGGPIGQSTMDINDDGTTITFTITKGPNNFNDALVLYFDTGVSGRAAIDGDVNDNGDPLRTAISNAGTSPSIVTFPLFFEASHAIALNASYAGLWSIPSSGYTDNLTHINSVGTPPLTTDPIITFSMDWSDIGLTNSDSFSFVGLYLSTSAWNSDEGYGDGITPGSFGGDAVNYTSAFEYPSGNTLNLNNTITNKANMTFFNNKLNINSFSGKATITVYDVLGRNLHSGNYHIDNNFELQLDLPKNQVYIVVMEGNNTKQTLKVISK